MTTWTATVTFVTFAYAGRFQGFEKAVDNFADSAPFYYSWKETNHRYTTIFRIKLNSLTKKNKILRYLRKLHDQDDNLQWCIVKTSAEAYDSDSSSDEYDGVYTTRSDTVWADSLKIESNLSKHVQSEEIILYQMWE